MRWIGRFVGAARAWRPTRRDLAEMSIALVVPFGWVILLPRLVPARMVRRPLAPLGRAQAPAASRAGVASRLASMTASHSVVRRSPSTKPT